MGSSEINKSVAKSACWYFSTAFSEKRVNTPPIVSMSDLFLRSSRTAYDLDHPSLRGPATGVRRSQPRPSAGRLRGGVLVPAMVRGLSGIAIGLLFLLSAGAARAQQTLYVVDGGVSNQRIDTWPTTATGDVAPSTILNSSSFSNASGVALDSATRIRVCDRTNNAIYEFPAGTTGTTTASHAFSGSNTTLNACRNIKFDASGNLVADTGNTDLIQFSASQQSTLLGGGSGNVAPAVTITSSAFSEPWDVAFDSSGTIYVADEGAGYIEVFPSSVLSRKCIE